MGNFTDITAKRFGCSPLAPVLLVASLVGCVGSPTPPPAPVAGVAGPVSVSAAATVAPSEVDLVQVGYSVADALLAELRKGHPAFDPDVPVLVTTFVSRSNLDSSSELGLLMADHVASRMTQQGYTIVEPKLRQELSIRREDGEFMLSRDVDKIQQENGAYAVVVGSYTEVADAVDFTAKIVEIKERKVLASVDAKLPIGKSFRDLLFSTGGGTLVGVVAQ